MPDEWIATGAALIASAQSVIILTFNPLIGASVDATGSYSGVMIGIAVFTVAPYAIWAAWKPPAGVPEARLVRR